jgi:CRP-like cAMP-binding protein
MFIIDSGEYDVYKKDDKNEVLVFTYTYPGAFGELSLIYGESRAATIKAKTDGKLWCLGRRVFKSIMTNKTNSGNPLIYLKSIPVLSECTYYQLQRLCEYSLEILVPAAEKIIDRNTESKYELYIVVSGSVQVTLANQETSIREATSFFAAFETGAGTKSVKNVTSISETKLLVIPRKAIIDVLGNELIAALSAALNKSHRYNLTIKESIFDKDVYLTINKKDYELKEATVLIGDFSYIA